MKNFLLVLLLVIISSCGTTTSVTRPYSSYPHENYHNYYYNPYRFSYGFGLGWEYVPRYYDRHYFYKKPVLPKDRHKPSMVYKKQNNRNVQTYTRPTGNVRPSYNTRRPYSTPQKRENVNSNSGRRNNVK